MVAVGCSAAGSRCCWSIFFQQANLHRISGLPGFIATDYACRIFSLAALYLLLRNEPTSLPIPWRLAAPSTKELLMALVGTITLISVNPDLKAQVDPPLRAARVVTGRVA
jgi:hypothetical protein